MDRKLNIMMVSSGGKASGSGPTFFGAALARIISLSLALSATSSALGVPPVHVSTPRVSSLATRPVLSCLSLASKTSDSAM
jgi:hypothetical protein